jgi:hypothetical protein
MSQFFSKITLIIILISITILGIIYIFKHDINQSFFAAVADKHQWAESIQSPKIILVGGSNLAFGIASDSIEKALKRPVVNLGVYAGFGLDFVLNETLPLVKKGDIVVLCTEYYLRKPGDDYAKETVALAYPPANKYIQYRNEEEKLEKKVKFYIRCARNAIFLPNRITNPTILDTISDYYRGGFSKRGDLLSHLNNPSSSTLSKLEEIQPQDYSVEIRRINQFIEQVKEKGARVFWTFPSYSQQGYSVNIKGLLYFEKQIKAGVHCPVISDLKDDIYPESCFYDTHFHLNHQCRLERTQRLIKALQKNIP